MNVELERYTGTLKLNKFNELLLFLQEKTTGRRKDLYLTIKDVNKVLRTKCIVDGKDKIELTEEVLRDIAALYALKRLTDVA